MSRFRRRFVRTSDDKYSVRISEEERDLLDHLIPQLRELLLSTSPTGGVDPMARRLFPTAYHDDPGHDATYQETTRDQLLASRLESLDNFEATTRLTTLTDDQIDDWTNAINQMRLVLGTRLDVGEDEEPTDIDVDNPETAHLATYHYLGYLLGEILDARMR